MLVSLYRWLWILFHHANVRRPWRVGPKTPLSSDVAFYTRALCIVQHYGGASISVYAHIVLTRINRHRFEMLIERSPIHASGTL